MSADPHARAHDDGVSRDSSVACPHVQKLSSRLAHHVAHRVPMGIAVPVLSIIAWPVAPCQPDATSHAHRESVAGATARECACCGEAMGEASPPCNWPHAANRNDIPEHATPQPESVWSIAYIALAASPAADATRCRPPQPQDA